MAQREGSLRQRYLEAQGFTLLVRSGRSRGSEFETMDDEVMVFVTVASRGSLIGRFLEAVTPTHLFLF